MRPKQDSLGFPTCSNTYVRKTYDNDYEFTINIKREYLYFLTLSNNILYVLRSWYKSIPLSLQYSKAVAVCNATLNLISHFIGRFSPENNFTVKT